MRLPLKKRVVAEGLGTFFLVAAVVGSGIMAERLAGGNLALALLANTAATGGALIALISTFGSLSGAHFNPVVTFASAWTGSLDWHEAPYYLSAQFLGGVLGVAIANVMFGLPLIFIAQHSRGGFAQLFSEFVATFGLVGVIFGASRSHVAVVALAIAAYISAAYWFTSSTSFANPAVTVARTLSDTFTGIHPLDVPGFVVAQFMGGVAATVIFRWLFREDS